MKDYQNLIGKILIAIAIVIAGVLFPMLSKLDVQVSVARLLLQ